VRRIIVTSFLPRQQFLEQTLQPWGFVNSLLVKVPFHWVQGFLEKKAVVMEYSFFGKKQHFALASAFSHSTRGLNNQVGPTCNNFSAGNFFCDLYQRAPRDAFLRFRNLSSFVLFSAQILLKARKYTLKNP